MHPVEAVLCQTDENDLLHPVAFESRKLNDAEKNYPVHEIECAAFVHALKRWRHYLDLRRFFVYTDNISLQTFHTNTNLSPRQVRWLDEMQQYQFTIRHIPRDSNVVADALSKYSHDSPPAPPQSLSSFDFPIAASSILQSDMDNPDPIDASQNQAPTNLVSLL